MPKKTNKESIDPTLQAAETTSRRGLMGGIGAAAIGAVALIVVAFINGWFSGKKQIPVPEGGIYRVRAIVLDLQGTPTDEARVWSTLGGELAKVSGGWKAEIPAASKPVDGKLTIFAAKESAFLTGQAGLILSSDYNPTVTITLRHDVSAKVRGQVIDKRNRAVAGARVFVVGYESEAIITKDGGNFDLPAHAASKQEVLLHAEKKGTGAVKQWHRAGDSPAILMLER